MRKIIDHSRKIEITVNSVDSIPCSLVGKKMIFSADGFLESEAWKLPWPMPWIETVFRTFAMENIGVSQRKSARLYNPDEPDQYLEISAHSYIDLTVGKLADFTADRFPGREALVSSTGSRRYLYRELKEMTDDLAKGLLSIGVDKGDKVGVWAVNSPEFVVAQIGISKAGGMMVPFNAYEKERRMEEILRLSDTRTLILQVGTKAAENMEILYRICPELWDAIPGNLKSPKLPMLKNVIVISDEEYPGTLRWTDLMESGRVVKEEMLHKREQQLSFQDVVHIIYTSGTTGVPKGVMLSHENIMENAVAMAERMRLTEKDIMCVQAPMFHCFGCVACTLTALISGCSMVMVDKFKPEITLSLIEREKCTAVSGVPTMFLGFINEISKNSYDISSMRTGIIAGSSCAPGIMKQIKEKLGIKELIVSYGLTEASPCVTSVLGDDPDELKETSVGKPIPGVDIKIMDLRTKEELPPGNPGEIWVKGYNIMQGYYRMKEETEKTVDAKGWLRTGDIGYVLPNGYLCIQDRCKDIIIRSGENISPKEIEDFLCSHELIEQAGVVGIPDDLYGEEVAAFLKVKEGHFLTDQEVKAFCKGKISTNKTPKWIFFIDSFPLSDSGKCLKATLRKLAAAQKEKLTLCTDAENKNRSS
jgi:fatty-acyl-CoA synthase